MGENIYLYGKFYDPDRERTPGQGSYDIILYQRVSPRERRVIGSLEGVFVSSVSSNEIFNGEGNRPIRRDEVAEFARKYHGRFIPFLDGVVRFVPESVGEVAARVNNAGK